MLPLKGLCNPLISRNLIWGFTFDDTDPSFAVIADMNRHMQEHNVRSSFVQRRREPFLTHCESKVCSGLFFCFRIMQHNSFGVY